MEKESKNWSEHPAYKEEDLEIKNEEELEEAKETAGVTSHKEVISRFVQRELESDNLEKIKEAYSKFMEAMKAGNRSEAGEYVEMLPLVPMNRTPSTKKLNDLFEALGTKRSELELEELQSYLDQYDPRLIYFRVCDDKRCMITMVVKQEYWGDDMGKSVIDEYR